jgi:hypothetical protein
MEVGTTKEQMDRPCLKKVHLEGAPERSSVEQSDPQMTWLSSVQYDAFTHPYPSGQS